MDAIQSLSIPQLAYLVASLSADQPQRPDGRSLTQFRRITYAKGVLSNCLGSVLLTWAGGATTILVGVKGEISQAIEQAAHGTRRRHRGGSMTVSVDIVGERDDETLAIQLSRSLQDLLDPPVLKERSSRSSGIDLRELDVTHEKAWHLNIDVQVLSHDGSNLTPACACAVRLAMLDTRIPKVNLGAGLAGNVEGKDSVMSLENQDDTQQGAPSLAQLDFTVDDDFDHAIPILSAAQIPLVVLAGVIGPHILFDCGAAEEQVLKARYLVSVSEKGEVVQLVSLGVKETRPGVLQSALGGVAKEEARRIAQTTAAIEQRGLEVDQVGRVLKEAVDVSREMYKALRANIEEPADLFDVL
jgi:exosome complex RNA-binding protein Rrp42 (RNase PH superfamily)